MSSYEYNQLLKFLYFEGYADSYEEAEYILEDLSDEEFEDLNESSKSWSVTKIRKFNKEIERQKEQRKKTPNSSLRPGDQAALANMLARRQSPTKSASKPDPTPTEKPKGTRTIKKTELASIVKEDFDIISEFLFVEGYADTIENAELMAESISEEWVEEILDEANKWEKKSGIGGKSPESELSRMRSRAFHTGGVGSKGSKNTVNPSDIDPGTLRMNRGVAQKVHNRNRGKSPSDPTYTHREKIDPPKIPSYRESPLGLPKGYKEPLKSRSKVGDKVNANIKPLQTKDSVDAKSNIRKFKREDLEYILDTLISEGFAVDYDSAGCILEAMSEEWVEEILDEKYVKAMDTTGRGADHRTRFPRFQGKDDEFDPKFTQQRVKSNTKKIDPYFSGRRERKDEKRKGVGGFSEAMSNRPEEPSHGRYPDSNKIDLAQQNAKKRFNKQKEIEAKWAKNDTKENKNKK